MRGLITEKIPPSKPIAGRETTWSSVQGRNEFNLGTWTKSSFVSCRSATEGLIAMISEKMSLHLSTSRRPRTFQERIVKGD